MLDRVTPWLLHNRRPGESSAVYITVGVAPVGTGVVEPVYKYAQSLQIFTAENNPPFFNIFFSFVLSGVLNI